jgi:predicted PurR-regulated permease PerM
VNALQHAAVLHIILCIGLEQTKVQLMLLYVSCLLVYLSHSVHWRVHWTRTDYVPTVQAVLMYVCCLLLLRIAGGVHCSEEAAHAGPPCVERHV